MTIIRCILAAFHSCVGPTRKTRVSYDPITLPGCLRHSCGYFGNLMLLEWAKELFLEETEP